MDKEKSLFELEGTIKKILFQSKENSYIIAVLEDDTKICGNYVSTNIQTIVGEELSFEGTWSVHKKYGKQFEFTNLKLKTSELFFFLAKIVKGLGETSVKTLLNKYEEDELIDILDNRPKELLKISGIKEKKLRNIIESWANFSHLRELGEFLAKYGVSTQFLAKIYAHFEQVPKLKEKLEANPYMLVDIKGIGFKKADEIGLSLGIPEKSAFRLKACLQYTLARHCDNQGNTSISKQELFTMLDDNLGFYECDELYEEIISQLLAKDELKSTSKDRLALAKLYFYEKTIMDFFLNRRDDLIPQKIVTNLDKYIKNKEKSLGFVLGEEQKKALEFINAGHKSIFLIGYAGTGKSTSSRAILELLEEKISYGSIRCLALSGIAAQRISETTGYKSSTIQSFLIQYLQEDFFPQEVILLDEASMVNSLLFYQICSKISKSCIFIVVGDDGQLPAIGAGNILSDCIKYELAPICKLTKLYRQNEKQALALIANDIRLAKVPEFEAKTYEDFSFKDISIKNIHALKHTLSAYELKELRDKNSQDILKEIVEIYASYIEKMNAFLKQKEISKYLTLFQIITPMKAGILGVENINKQIQKIFNNSSTKVFKTKLYSYRLADKVIHIKNENMKIQTMDMYKNKSNEFIEKRVFNGQLGVLVKLDFIEEKIIVFYPNDDMVVFYDFDTISTYLNLAYCLSIHKTQGMEYNAALLPMTSSHFIMHNTKLLYTAITRAKNMCYVVGQKDAFVSACKKIETTKRQSVINDILSAI